MHTQYSFNQQMGKKVKSKKRGSETTESKINNNKSIIIREPSNSTFHRIYHVPASYRMR